MKVLDHGFVRVVDRMGDDAAIVQAARVSYGDGTKTPSDDRKLIDYLMRHRHTSPFEMCELKLHLKMPIFIARQWVRHRTASINECSARYSVLKDDFYVPEHAHIAMQSTSNKQGRATAFDDAGPIANAIEEAGTNAYAVYTKLLDDKVARELARMVLPINAYTEMYWKIDLHNLLHFIALRLDSHAQYEIRVYAKALLDIVKAWVPFTFEAFMDHRIEGAVLSGKALDVIRRRLKGETVTQDGSSLSAREWQELCDLIDRPTQKVC